MATLGRSKRRSKTRAGDSCGRSITTVEGGPARKMVMTTVQMAIWPW